MEIFQNTIVKLIVRQGTNSERKTIMLNSGELGYSTDTERLFVGNGYLNGGVLVGNLFKGKASDVTTFAPCEIGDMAFNTDKNKLVYVKTNDGSTLSDWEDLTTGIISSGDQYINVTNDYTISLNSLSAGIISNDIVASGSPIYMDNDGRLDMNIQFPLVNSGGNLTVDTTLLVNTIYPIGAIYLSYNNTNPAVLFPGTAWAQIAQGMFIAGIGTSSDINSYTKTISAGNNAGVYRINIPLPPHRHGIGRFTDAGNNDAWFTYGDWDDGSTNTGRLIIGEKTGTAIAPIPGSPWGMKSSLPVETGVPTVSAISPPAYGVYMWRRVS